MELNGARRLVSQLQSAAAPSALASALSGAVSGAPGVLRRWRGAFAAAAVIPALVACSSVPDAVNPVSWYEGVAGWFDDEEEETAEYEAGGDDDGEDGEEGGWWIFGGDDDEDEDSGGWWIFGGDDEEDAQADLGAEDEDGFPNLASVPDRPAAARGGSVAGNLAADPNRPEYAPAVERQGEAQLALGAQPPAAADASGAAAQQQVSGAYQPAPPAMPKAPVTSEAGIETAVIPNAPAAAAPAAPAASGPVSMTAFREKHLGAPKAPASFASLGQTGQGIQGQGIQPPPPPVFAAAPAAVPAAAPYTQPPAPGGRIVLTPPGGAAPQPQPQIAALGPTPLPAVLTDISSHHAFEAFRAQMRQGFGAAAAQFAYSPHAAGGGAGGYAPQHQTVVISSGGVSSVPAAYGGGYAGAPVSGGAMLRSSTAPGFAAPQASSGGGAAPQALSGFNTINSPHTVLAPGSVKVATILFSNGSASLKGEDRGILNRVASLQRQQGGAVRVIGHASGRTRTMDPDRRRLVNYEISAGRAGAVAEALVGMGVPREAILVGAVSDAEPLFYEVMPSGEAGNRRTEIYLDT